MSDGRELAASSIERGLSIVMIGRDEEAVVGLALEAIRSYAQEVVFVDTGSVDSTLQRVEAYGARVFSFPWQDDFSKAKNFGVERAQFSWILNIDCDEILKSDGVEEFLETLKEDQHTPAYTVQIDNILDDGSSYASQALRLFRNNPQIRYRNPVHESVGEAVFENFPDHPIGDSPIILEHYGYTSQRKLGKKERNLDILEKWVKQDPQNIYANYKLAQAYAGMNQGHDAERCFSCAFEGLDRSSDRGTYPFVAAFLDSYFIFLREQGREEREVAVRERIKVWN